MLQFLRLKNVLLCLFMVTAVPSVAWAASLPHPESSFKGKIGLTAKESEPDWPQSAQAPEGAPNVVLILLDDVGFGATETFGGPVATPVLERLAAQGLRYNQFHTAGLCSPTRAALLSGRNQHRLGFGAVPELASGYPGYNAHWPRSAASVAQVLKHNGYHTSVFGKWHNTPVKEITSVGPFDRWPTGLGFDYFYGFQGGETSQWEPVLYRGTELVEAPASESDYHLTEDLVDDAIVWVREHEVTAPEKPFFLYFSTGAVHAPHHVPQQWIDQYEGRFDEGWDTLREEIFAHQKALGVIPESTELTSRPAEIPAWLSLDQDQRHLLAKQMEVFAAFLAHTDYEIGRLIDAVQQTQRADNTVILYVVGDNGGSTEGGPFGTEHSVATYMGLEPEELATRVGRLEELGGVQHSNNYAAGWAWATNTPFQWVKQVASHLGATRNPLVVSWPKGIADQGGLRSQFHHVIDIVPTIYDMAGIDVPDHVNGVEQMPLDGVSMQYTLTDAAARSRRDSQYFEVFGNRALYRNGWLAGVRVGVPWDFNKSLTNEEEWELYYLPDDFSQAHNLAHQRPEKLVELRKAFSQTARDNHIYPLLPALVSEAQKRGHLAAGPSTSIHTYYRGMSLSQSAAPELSRSHRITAELDIPPSGAEGVIFAHGGRTGGVALYVLNGHLVYERRFTNRGVEVLSSSSPLPAGKVQVAFEYQQDDSDTVGRLTVGNEVVGEKSFSYPYHPNSETFDIGEDKISPVSDSYDTPFRFSAVIEKLTVELY